MESMERIDVLKGIEKILVDKAYETGHISHRADGDWQKQADGSWTPYTGQSASQGTPEEEKYALGLAGDPAKIPEDTEYGEITEEDLIETPNDTIYSTEDITATTIDGEDAYEIAGTPVVAMKDPTGKWQVMDGDKIVADGLNTALAHETMVKTMNDKYSFNDEEDFDGLSKDEYSNKKSWLDACDRYGVKPVSDPINTIINKIKDQQYTYDEFYKALAKMGYLGRLEYGYGKERLTIQNDKGAKFELLVSADKNSNGWWNKPFKVLGVKLYKKPPKYDKTPYEELLAENDGVQKSAVRDMRSALAVKNMGF